MGCPNGMVEAPGGGCRDTSHSGNANSKLQRGNLIPGGKFTGRRTTPIPRGRQKTGNGGGGRQQQHQPPRKKIPNGVTQLNCEQHCPEGGCQCNGWVTSPSIVEGGWDVGNDVMCDQFNGQANDECYCTGTGSRCGSHVCMASNWILC